MGAFGSFMKKIDRLTKDINKVSSSVRNFNSAIDRFSKTSNARQAKNVKTRPVLKAKSSEPK